MSLKNNAAMQRNAAALLLTGFLVALLALAPVLPGAFPSQAFAETTNIDAEADAAQQLVESSAAEYEAAVARVAELEQQIEDNEKRAAELETLLPELRERGEEALGELYKLGREEMSLIDLILSSENFSDFISRVEYVDRIYKQHSSDVAELQSAVEEQVLLKESLVSDLAEAQAEKQHASDALAAAQAAREEAQRAAQAKAEEEARFAAEEAAKKEAEQQAAESSSASSSVSSSSGESSGSSDSVPEVTPPSNDNADWSTDKATFVNAWAGRIDAYLAGSPLGGQGATFAAAAWDYGVDPRFSPAISCVESSKGAACFASHNAWGWGSISWGSWEEAIDAHVRGLARGYGYTVTIEGAKKYCPPNWEHWYNRVSEEMNKI